MKAIEQTTLSINDIKEHHTMLEHNQCIDLFLPADRRQEVADDMVLRFVHTFLEDYNYPALRYVTVRPCYWCRKWMNVDKLNGINKDFRKQKQADLWLCNDCYKIWKNKK